MVVSETDPVNSKRLIDHFPIGATEGLVSHFSVFFSWVSSMDVRVAMLTNTFLLLLPPLMVYGMKPFYDPARYQHHGWL